VEILVNDFITRSQEKGVKREEEKKGQGKWEN
jgi:hypothetical protein